MIRTIADLEKARPEEIAKALTEVSVVDDLNRYLEWLHSDQGVATTGTFTIGYKPRAKGIHPSAIAKTDVCPLKIFYDCTHEVVPRKKINVDMHRIFDMGTINHSMYQMHFNNMYGEQFADEVWLKDKKLHVSSHADGVFQFSPVRFVLEMKTIREGGNFGFERVQHKPFEDNVRQCMSYMKFSDCPFGLIFYVCKNNSKIKEHPLVFDWEIWNEIEAFTAPIVDAAYNGGEKPRPKVGPHCKECEYFHGCPYGKRGSSGERHKNRFTR